MYEQKLLTSEAGEALMFVGVDPHPGALFDLRQTNPHWKSIQLTEAQAREVFEFLGQHLGIEVKK